MGDPQAREIEEKLGLEKGWMDTPPGLDALENETGRQMLDLFNQLPVEERSTALRLLHALVEPQALQAAGGQSQQ